MRPSLQWVGLALVCLAIAAHQALFWEWFIEDAAISFAYAKNLASGEGLVPFVGGERVEGYSNPTWVAAMTLPHLLGVDVFAFAKWLQLVLALATAALVYLAVRDADDDGWGPARGLLAAAFLAACSPFALWGSAGLEGGLLAFLLALGIWRMGVECERDSAPWSALAWCLLALTRPEGILYAAVGGLCAMYGRAARGRWLAPTAQWLLLFFVPFGLHQLWRWWYFAWPLPNTYYAKLAEREPGGMSWTTGGFRSVRNFFHVLGYGYFLPVWILGALSPSALRSAVACAALLIAGTSIELADDQRLLLLVWLGSLWAAFVLSLRAGASPGDPSPTRLIIAGTAVSLALIGITEAMRAYGSAPVMLPAPSLVKRSPPYVLVALALLLPLLPSSAERARRAQLRLVAFGACCASLLFAVYVQWDWMKGFRWFAPAAVPGAILFALGVDALIGFLQSSVFGRTRVGWSIGGTLVAVLLVAATAPANIVHSRAVMADPDASPKKIKVRVDYVDKVSQRLHIDERVVDLDVDQGAHLYWSNLEMMDFAGLIDVPFAHNHYEKDFVREYLFEERRPHFAHVHGSWAQRTKIPTHPEWREQYLELPPYPTGRRSQHPGTFLRRDLIVGKPTQEIPMARFQGGLALYDVRIPSEPGEGKKVYVEIDVGFGEAQPTNFRMVLFFSDDTHLASFELPPGYDWLPPSQWRQGEAFEGRFTLPLPGDLPPGRYAIGLVIFGPDGSVTPEIASDALPGTPRMAHGEHLSARTIDILTVETRAKAAADDRKAAFERSKALDCEGAEESWHLAQKHRAGESSWRAEHEPPVRRAIATCWSISSDNGPLHERAERLSRARELDHHAPAYLERASALSALLVSEGRAASSRGDWEAAYRHLSDAASVDRTNAWARRWAEEARAARFAE